MLKTPKNIIVNCFEYQLAIELFLLKHFLVEVGEGGGGRDFKIKERKHFVPKMYKDTGLFALNRSRGGFSKNPGTMRFSGIADFVS